MEKGTRELHTGPDAIAAVPCPLRFNEQIAMGRCVEYQRDNGCHCEHALTALRRTEKHLLAPVNVLSAYDTTARADQLDGVRALIERAEAMERARPRIPTPAPPRAPPAPRPPSAEVAAAVLAARNPPTLAQVYREAQVPPPPAPRCEIQGCTNHLRVNNLSGVCQEHRQAVPSRKRAGLVPAIARASGTAGDLIQQVAAPAEPAKESKMAAGAKGAAYTASDDEIRSAFKEAGGSINKMMEKLGTTSWRAVKNRVDALGLAKAAIAPAPAKAPPKAKKKPRLNGKRILPPPRTLASVAARHVKSAPPADIIHLLEDKLAHHREQADKCERALAALR